MSPAGGAVVRWLARAEALLGAAAPRLDALNLFPVPDADTGTNMHATMQSVRAELDRLSAEQQGEPKCHAHRAS